MTLVNAWLTPKITHADGRIDWCLGRHFCRRPPVDACSQWTKTGPHRSSGINATLDATGFWKRFPPEGTDVVSWCVTMGIGQVVTLLLPAAKLRDVNLAIEQSAWDAVDTEFHPAYDFQPVRQRIGGKVG